MKKQSPFRPDTSSLEAFIESIKGSQSHFISMEGLSQSGISCLRLEGLEELPDSIQQRAMEQIGTEALLEHVKSVTAGFKDQSERLTQITANFNAFRKAAEGKVVQFSKAEFMGQLANTLPLDTGEEMLFCQAPGDNQSMIEMFDQARCFIIELGQNINTAASALVDKIKNGTMEGDEGFIFALPEPSLSKAYGGKLFGLLGLNRYVWKEYPVEHSNTTEWVSAGLVTDRSKLPHGQIPALDPASVEQFMVRTPLESMYYENEDIIDKPLGGDWIAELVNIDKDVQDLLEKEDLSLEYKTNYVNGLLYRIDNLFQNRQSLIEVVCGYGQALKALAGAIEQVNTVTKQEQ